MPKITILIAVRNESAHIAETLECLCRQDCPPDWLEVMVLDGCSTDNTKSIANQFKGRLPALKIVDNPKILSASAWNLGISLARGEIISILSGHVELPTNFYSTLLPILTPDIAGVGGQAVPVGRDKKSKTIASAFSSILGNGGASFMSDRAEGSVESIAFGCYWRKTLQEIGGFDENIVRGQDWDLNLRIRSLGKQLHYTSKITVNYHTRSNFVALWRRQYLAGLWKRYIHQKSSKPFLIRHRVPGVFSGVLLSSILASFAWPPLVFLALGIFTLHLAATVWQFSRTSLPASEFLSFWWALLIIHIGYGAGIILGSIRSPI